MGLEIEEPYVPQGIAGIFTTQCECGWEFVCILPEEADNRMLLILQHLREAHGIQIPLMICKHW